MYRRIDIEEEDLRAAKAVRSALSNLYQDSKWDSVEHAVGTLIAHNQIDLRIAQYVFENTQRFAMCPAPIFFRCEMEP